MSWGTSRRIGKKEMNLPAGDEREMLQKHNPTLCVLGVHFGGISPHPEACCSLPFGTDVHSDENGWLSAIFVDMLDRQRLEELIVATLVSVDNGSWSLSNSFSFRYLMGGGSRSSLLASFTISNTNQLLLIAS